MIAFAARRAIDRGVALGYLENLAGFALWRAASKGRRDDHHRFAPADQARHLVTEYEALGPDLRRGGPQDSWWSGFRRELGELVQVHRADRPPASADARYSRALQRLGTGEVDQALAETMRLPGARQCRRLGREARRYIAAHRALDEIESAALLTGPAPAA